MPIQKTDLVLTQTLWEAWDPVVECRFLHDRLQQAAYSLLPDEERPKVHLHIGQQLYHANYSKTGAETAVNDVTKTQILEHINVGYTLITDEEEKLRYALLNFVIAQRARRSVAYAAAVKYIDISVHLLTGKQVAEIGPDILESTPTENACWTPERHEQTFAIFLEATICHFLILDSGLALTLSKQMLKRSPTNMELAIIYEKQIQFNLHQHKLKEALQVCMEAIETMKIELISEAPKIPSAEVLASLPEMDDEEELAQMRAMTAMVVTAYITAPDIFEKLAFPMTHVAIIKGVSLWAAVGLLQLAIIFFKYNPDEGYRAGLQAMNLLDQSHTKDLYVRMKGPFYGFIEPWNKSLATTIAPLEKAIDIGTEVGALEGCAFAYCWLVNALFYSGHALDSLAPKIEHICTTLLSRHQGFQAAHMYFNLQLVRRLLCHSPTTINTHSTYNRWEFNFGGMSVVQDATDEAVLDYIKAAGVGYYMVLYHVCGGIAHYFTRDGLDLAFDAFRSAEPYMYTIVGSVLNAALNFYYSLVLISRARRLLLPISRDCMSLSTHPQAYCSAQATDRRQRRVDRDRLHRAEKPGCAAQVGIPCSHQLLS
eukprot:TRINITY_DN8190_c0_g1_i1.p1 TRINITY_DN8190_c0_g1~~TRINITY_DN8190_c0_g1_i1.p1  ORF type:complete len:597 (-),score=67.52 TRINITY_DN8190_c0_g1_i1:142-1932(-)